MTINNIKVSESYSYDAYKDLLNKLFAENKTTGENHSEAMMHYAKMNIQRMKRWDKTVQLSSEVIDVVAQINEKQTWYVLTEGWCGDAAQNLPFINKIASINEHIELKMILRDENLEIMDQYLTNGGRSIPKLFALDAEGNELFQWGPRPAPVQKMAVERKENPESISYEDYNINAQKWYNKDKGATVQNEFTALISRLVLQKL